MSVTCTGSEYSTPAPSSTHHIRSSDQLCDDHDNGTDRVCPSLSFWRTIRGWYAARNLPNLLLVHFNDLKADLEGEIRRIADFLDVPVSEDKRADILEHCSFAYMKEHAVKMAPPQADVVWEGGAGTFINKGSNGRWRDVLSAEDVRRYEEKAVEELGEECAGWLAEGRKAWEE